MNSSAPAGASAPRAQYAALPFRLVDDQDLRVLLITSLRTRRWVLPKGWQKPNASPMETAAREAFEEAGVCGDVVSPKALGFYSYEKHLDGGASASCRVGVFALRVSHLAGSWPEKGQRALRWCTSKQAARLVHEPELAAILDAFAPPRA